ncbi:DUF2197 domain-containing protein [Lysinibacillus halotolerans]|uniref:DUF2197 domain-containing protein n=1 Tax=Lysinibacillus halotolerans TaxID=1368476 RepID=A0A3M8H3W7_9BACI|nr:DUF2197 domain-containing protein [Lysinibacillus halotolerans]RNC97176.1 DUF2197 domain-containing protein [Lysinibacillus halotolerans]
MSVNFYEVTCLSCKQKYKVYEGSKQYKDVKERKSNLFCCEDCGHKIRMEAIKNFLNKMR